MDLNGPSWAVLHWANARWDKVWAKPSSLSGMVVNIMILNDKNGNLRLRRLSPRSRRLLTYTGCVTKTAPDSEADVTGRMICDAWQWPFCRFTQIYDNNR